MKLERVERLNLGLSAGAVAASFAFATPHFATGLAIGAALEAMNFGSLYRGAKHFFAGEFGGAGPWVGLFGLRFVLLGVAIFITLHSGVHPVALTVGLSIAMPAALIDAWLHRPEIIPPDTLPSLEEDDPSWDAYSVWHAAEVEPHREADGPEIEEENRR
jgi:hypothetical protein